MQALTASFQKPEGLVNLGLFHFDVLVRLVGFRV